jgi:hypothetical protein
MGNPKFPLLTFKRYEVFLLCDGISSGKPIERKAAFKLLEKAGAILTTSESVLFDIMRDAKHPKFK